MPLIRLIDINKASSYGLWKIEESLDQLQLLLDSMDDLQFKGHPEKIRESLAGRLIIRRLCEQMNLPFNGVVKDENGKPHLKASSIQISISHSYPLAAAMIHLHSPCGIDIEKPRDKIRRIARKFLSEEEQDWAEDSIERLTLLWSAKETLYKLHGRRKLHFSSQLRVKPISERKLSGTIISMGHQLNHTLMIESFEDFIITFLYR